MKTICGTSRCYVDFENSLQLVGHIFLWSPGVYENAFIIYHGGANISLRCKIYRVRYLTISCEVHCHFLLSISIQPSEQISATNTA